MTTPILATNFLTGSLLGPAATVSALLLAVVWTVILLSGQPVVRLRYRMAGVFFFVMSLSMLLGFNDGGYGGRIGDLVAENTRKIDLGGLSASLLAMAVIASVLLATDWMFVPLYLRIRGGGVAKAPVRGSIGRYQVVGGFSHDDAAPDSAPGAVAAVGAEQGGGVGVAEAPHEDRADDTDDTDDADERDEYPAAAALAGGVSVAPLVETPQDEGWNATGEAYDAEYEVPAAAAEPGTFNPAVLEDEAPPRERDADWPAEPADEIAPAGHGRPDADETADEDDDMPWYARRRMRAAAAARAEAQARDVAKQRGESLAEDNESAFVAEEDFFGETPGAAGDAQDVAVEPEEADAPAEPETLPEAESAASAAPLLGDDSFFGRTEEEIAVDALAHDGSPAGGAGPHRTPVEFSEQVAAELRDGEIAAAEAEDEEQDEADDRREADEHAEDADDDFDTDVGPQDAAVASPAAPPADETAGEPTRDEAAAEVKATADRETHVEPEPQAAVEEVADLDAGLSDEDRLYAQAGDAVVDGRKASISFLQRTLGVGYFQAAKLLDRLEKDKIIGPYTGGVNREVFASADQWRAKRPR